VVQKKVSERKVNLFFVFQPSKEQNKLGFVLRIFVLVVHYVL